MLDIIQYTEFNRAFVTMYVSSAFVMSLMVSVIYTVL